jgi:hypothetical protein
MAVVKNQWNFSSESGIFIVTGCSSVWWSTAFGTLGPLVQVQSSRFLQSLVLASPPPFFPHVRRTFARPIDRGTRLDVAAFICIFFHCHSPVVAGRSSLFLRVSLDPEDPDLFTSRRGRLSPCREGHAA